MIHVRLPHELLPKSIELSLFRTRLEPVDIGGILMLGAVNRDFVATIHYTKLREPSDVFCKPVFTRENGSYMEDEDLNCSLIEKVDEIHRLYDWWTKIRHSLGEDSMACHALENPPRDICTLTSSAVPAVKYSFYNNTGTDLEDRLYERIKAGFAPIFDKLVSNAETDVNLEFAFLIVPGSVGDTVGSVKVETKHGYLVVIGINDLLMMLEESEFVGLTKDHTISSDSPETTGLEIAMHRDTYDSPWGLPHPYLVDVVSVDHGE